MREVVVSQADRPAKINAGIAPMMQWLRIEQLRIDDSYQRELARANWTAIRKIAAEFKWSRFSPVFCAPIEGGLFAIIDGQHRTHAAAMCGFAEVPCQIVQMEPGEQAASFAAVNGGRIKVTPIQVYKAALAAGEQWAVDCRNAVEAAGCRLMLANKSQKDKKPGEIFGLQMIRKFVDRGQSRTVTHALGALLQSQGGANEDAWSADILKPLLIAVTERPRLLGEPVARLAGFLDEFDLWEAVDRAADRAKQEKRQGFAKPATTAELAALAIGKALDDAFKAGKAKAA